MSYGLFLYKTIAAIDKVDRDVTINIYSKDFVGTAIEIDAISKESIVLTLDNQGGDIYAPIIKSNLTFGIIDTEQIDYSVLFTPDAIKYKVELQYNNAVEWTGYLTPDSFVESLAYRDTITLTARDNIGFLEEFDFEYTEAQDTIENVYLEALSLINSNFTLEYKSNKVSEGHDVKDLFINTQIADKTWFDVLSSLFQSLGWQLRFIGSNTLRIFDIGDLKSLGGEAESNTFQFLNKSGMREIIPSWRELKINQDYKLKDNIYSVSQNEGIEIDSTFDFPIPPRSPYYVYKQNQNVSYYNFVSGSNITGDITFPKPEDWSSVETNLHITGTTNLTNNDSLLFTQIIDKVDTGAEITFRLPNVVNYPIDVVYYSPSPSFAPNVQIKRLEPDIMNSSSYSYSLKYRFNVFFETATTNYVLRGNWVEFTSINEYITFSTEKNGYRTRWLTFPFPYDDSLVTLKDDEYTINISSFPAEAGVLKIAFYKWYVNETTPRGAINLDSVAIIKDITVSLTGELEENYESKFNISPANIRQNIDFTYGEVPENKGGIAVYEGGLYKSDEFYPTAHGFSRGGISYKLSELVARELIHHFTEPKNKLNGSIYSADNNYFNNYFEFRGLEYCVNYASFNVLNGQCDIELVEATDYVDPYPTTTTTTSTTTSTTTTTTSTTTTTTSSTTTTTTTQQPRLQVEYFGFDAYSDYNAWLNSDSGSIWWDPSNYTYYTTETGNTQADTGYYCIDKKGTFEESLVIYVNE